MNVVVPAFNNKVTPLKSRMTLAPSALGVTGTGIRYQVNGVGGAQELHIAMLDSGLCRGDQRRGKKKECGMSFHALRLLGKVP